MCSGHRLGRIGCVLLALTLNSCISVKFGEPIVTSGLEQLTLGESTHGDILLALGQPRGKGGAVVSFDQRARRILFYEYITANGRKVSLEILLVFLAGDRYDGHLWFASTERVRREGGIPGLTSADKTTIGEFPETTPLESQFQRGRTTRDAVIQALGSPVGSGEALLPPRHNKSEVLYYEDIEAGTPKLVDGVYVFDMRQRILLVLITDGAFDGFFWYSTTGRPEAKVQ